MPRLTVVEPTQTTGRVKEIFDGPLKGKNLNIFKGMANSAALLDGYLGLSAALTQASLNQREQEVVQLAVVQAANCDYCTAAHTAIGKGAGLTEDQLLGARRGHIESDPRLGALARFAAALYEKRGDVSDADLAQFRAAGFTDQHIGEVVVVFAQATLTSTFNHINHTPVDFPTPPAL
jgi:AhpD family alkylhydroperoxidase